MPAGRPTKLTPHLQARIVSMLANGSYVETAALRCGVTKATFYAWLERGEKDDNGPYREFLDAIKGAQAEAEDTLLTTVGNGGQGWQGAAWVLERTRRDKYALQTKADVKLEHTGKDGGPVQVVTAVEVTRMLDALRQDTPPDDGGTED